MSINRRQFLAATSIGLASYISGCINSPTMRRYRLENWDLHSGQTISNSEISIPVADWYPLDSNGHGFLLASGQSVLALDFKNNYKYYSGPDDARWIRPDLIITAERPASDSYRLRASSFPQGETRWQQVLPQGNILGFNQDFIYLDLKHGVSCFDLVQGKEIWHNHDLLDIKCAYAEPDSLVVSQGNRGAILWLDLKTGKVIQHLNTTATDNRVILIVGDGKTTLTFTRHLALAGFRQGQAQPIWVQPVNTQAYQSRLLGFAQGIALIELYDSTTAVDINSGKLLWSDSLGPHLSICQDVVLLRRGLGLGQGKFQQELQARNLRTGHSLWQRQLDNIGATTAASNDHFVILASL